MLNEKDGFQPSEVNQQIVAAPKRRHVPPSGKWPVDEEILSAADVATGG